MRLSGKGQISDSHVSAVFAVLCVRYSRRIRLKALTWRIERGGGAGEGGGGGRGRGRGREGRVRWALTLSRCSVYDFH